MTTDKPDDTVSIPQDLEVSDLGAIPPGLLKQVIAVLSGVGSLVIFLLMILINGDILGRFFLNKPIPGVPEIVELSIVAIVFLQIADSTGAGRFVRSDEIHKRFTKVFPRLGTLLACVFEIAGAGLLAVLAYGTFPLFIEAWNDNLYAGHPGVFTAPTWPVQLTIVVGSGLTALVFVYAAWRHFVQIRAPRR